MQVRRTQGRDGLAKRLLITRAALLLHRPLAGGEFLQDAGRGPSPRSYQPARCFDFRKRIAQFDCERTEQIAAACR